MDLARNTVWSRRTIRGICALPVLAAAFGCTAMGADFSFAAIIRVGQGNGTWELGIGGVPGAPAATVSLNPYYQDSTSYRFEIGYTQSTNTAFVRVQNLPGGGYTQTSYQPVGGGPMAPGGHWTLPASAFSVQALSDNRPTSITVSGLTLTAGSVLQGFSTTTLFASQPGNPNPPDVTTRMPSPVFFLPDANGDWLLGGTITFVGIVAGGATDNKLRFDLTAQSTDTPEPSTISMACIGLLLILVAAIRPRKIPLRLKP